MDFSPPKAEVEGSNPFGSANYSMTYAISYPLLGLAFNAKLPQSFRAATGHSHLVFRAGQENRGSPARKRHLPSCHQAASSLLPGWRLPKRTGRDISEIPQRPATAF